MMKVYEGNTHFVKLVERDVPAAKRILVISYDYDGSDVFCFTETLTQST